MFYKIRGISPKSGKGTVYCVYRQNGKECLRTTGVAVAPADFDPATGKVKSRVPQHPELNAKIQAVALTIEGIVRDLKADGLEASSAAVAAALADIDTIAEADAFVLPILEKADAQSLEALRKELAWLESETLRVKTAIGRFERLLGIAAPVKLFTDKIADYLKADPNFYRPATVRGYEDLRVIIGEFRPQLRLEEIDLDTFREFQKYLLAKGMRNNSVRTHLDRLKTVYRYLADEAGLSAEFLKKFRQVPELANDDVIYLTREEVAAIAALKLTKTQRQVQQQFLFACATGLRHQSLNITTANITGETLTVVTGKKNLTVKPPITPAARAILNGPDFPFRKYHVNHFNKVLRAICKKAPGFDVPVTVTHYVGNVPTVETKPKWEHMSSHVGRKTAINHWLASGVRESVVSLWAAHRDTKTTAKHYANKDAISAQEALKLL
ncbi:hypothetical protein GCM10023172_14980 [Hymenobacter ginsengisoli]|uniref:Core-binding (CB) domain-containing protein n=1 Tax=Hymenobacter ginsengisoli TaxID=1051626 RepID=A0ABP8Q6E4_9BACT|nr:MULTISPECIES: phage integrase SAM-like domain-containing protein [unclassified Hymenobacter]MBO2030952.1 phage integrase SAM-like domain-containing protein [Hymenobacter sp. BT559]